MPLLRLDYTKLASMGSLLPSPFLLLSLPLLLFLLLFSPSLSEVGYHVTSIPMERPHGEKLDNNLLRELRSILYNLSQALR